MKIFLLTVFVSLSACTQVFSQSIEVDKKFIGYEFTLDENRLSLNDLEVLFKENEQSLSYLSKAKSQNNFSQIISGIGGFLIGWPLGTAIAGGDPEWAMAGVGAGLVAVSIPIYIKSQNNAEKAVKFYNANRSLAKSYFKPNLSLVASSNMLGIKMSF